MNAFLPMSEAVLSSGLILFNKVGAAVTAFVSVVLILRMTYLVVKISPGSEYGDLLKDAVSFFGILSIFPMILKLVIFGTADLARRISFIAPPESQSGIRSFFNRMFSDYPLLSIFGKIGDVLILGLANAVYTALLSLFVASAPVFFFMALLLNIHHGFKSYFGLIISLSLWPVMWNILGQLSVQISSQFNDSPVASVCYWIVILVLQLISPIFSFMLFKTLSTNTGVGTVARYGGMLWR